MKRIYLIMGAIMIGCIPLRSADALTEALQKGLFEEEANHNLDAAIKAYQDVLSRADEQRRVAATALFRLAECYRKQGKTNEASAEYRRLVRDYADQTTLVNLSRQNLSGLGISSAGANAAESGVAPTDAEEQQIRRIRSMIRDSPDLVNARSQGQGGSTELINAARQGHMRVVDYLLANGADVEIRDLYNGKPDKTPLHVAAANGHKRVVEALLAKGAGVNAVDQFGRTALHLAVGQGFRGVIDALLAHKANVNVANHAGQTPLHTAIDATHLELAKFLIDRGANVNFVAETRASPSGVARPISGGDGQEGTILHYAVLSLKPALVELLLKNGADANARTARGLTALHEISDGENVPATRREIASLLIEHKAEVNAVGTGVGTGKDFGGWPPLYVATLRGLIEVAELLLDKGADPNVLVRLFSGSEPATALHLAVTRGNDAIAELLLKKGAHVDALNANGNTALHAAASTGSTNLVALLLRHNADPNGGGGRGRPLINPVHQNYLAVAEMLLAKGADPNVTNSHGTPLLHVALGSRPPGAPGLSIPAPPAAVGNVPGQRLIPPRRLESGQPTRPVSSTRQEEKRQKTMFDLLMEHKANPDIRDNMASKESETTLHLAARINNDLAVESLLAAGADVNARTESGISPLHWATQHGNLRVIDMLLERKANLNAANEKGETPLHQGVSSGLTNVVAPLLQAGADINACSAEGDTPLRRFIRTRTIDKPDEFAFVEFLAKAGADVVKKCGRELSPFEYSFANANYELTELLRKYHPKKLASLRLEGQVRQTVWFWEAENRATLSQSLAVVGLTDKADPMRVTVLRDDPNTGLKRRSTYDLLAIREKRSGHPDVPLQDGDKIIVDALK